MIVPDCRVLTWNVWWRFGDWASRQPLIADVVGSTGADIVALQEVWVHGDGDQSHELATAAGLEHIAWSPNRQPDRWRQRVPDQPNDIQCGIAVLSRWPIVETIELPLPAGSWPSEGRTALGLLIDHPRGLLPVVNTHLDSHPARSELRVEQLRAVATLTHEVVQRAGQSGLAPIVCGDMNAEPESDEIRRFAGVWTAPFVEDLGFHDAWRIAGPDSDPGWTWRRDNPFVEDGNPNARIDYVFTGLSGRVASVALVGLGDGLVWPSDHAGVLADLRP